MVELAPSTNLQSNKDRLKHIFATYGMLQRLESAMDNYSNSNEFNEFAIQEEFQHH